MNNAGFVIRLKTNISPYIILLYTIRCHSRFEREIQNAVLFGSMWIQGYSFRVLRSSCKNATLIISR